MSRKRPRRWRPPPCDSGKIAYRTRGRALGALRAIAIGNAQAAAGTSSKQPIGTYKCGCGAWHLTSQTARS